jgi:hypothetical protein
MTQPQRRRDRPFATWCPTAIGEMLRRELYMGRRIWNKAKFVKTPGTNKRVARPRPRKDWQVQELLELQIVPSELWDMVQHRLNRLKEIYADSDRKPVNRGAASPYLLSGFLRCGSCGANLIIVSGGGRGRGTGVRSITTGKPAQTGSRSHTATWRECSSSSCKTPSSPPKASSIWSQSW